MDAIYMKRGQPMPRNELLMKGPDGHSNRLDDRWLPIMGKKNARMVGSSRRGVHWSRFYGDLNDPTPPEFPIFWSGSERNIGAPIYCIGVKGEPYEKGLWPGVHAWGMQSAFSWPYLPELGFKPYKGTLYEYWIRFEIILNGPNVSRRIDLAMPGKQPWKKRVVKAASARDLEREDWQPGEEHLGETPAGYEWVQTGDPDAPMPAGDLYNLVNDCVMTEKFSPYPKE